MNTLILGRKIDFKWNLRFVEDKFILTKGSRDVIIYYDNGKTEKTSIREAAPFCYIIKIKNQDYYMDNDLLKPAIKKE